MKDLGLTFNSSFSFEDHVRNSIEGMTLYIGDLSTNNLENQLPFVLQCWSTTQFEGFVELSALPLYLERFGGKTWSN